MKLINGDQLEIHDTCLYEKCDNLANIWFTELEYETDALRISFLVSSYRRT